MVSKKAIAGVAVALVILIVGALLFFYQSHTEPNTNGNSHQNPQSPLPQPQMTYKAILEVNGYVSGGYWTRNATTDLPDYLSTVVYSISNSGNATAQNVDLEIMMNGKSYTSNLIPSLSVWGRATYSLTISTPYDSSSTLSIQASCSDSINSCSFSVGRDFPRSFNDDSGIARLFITPREANLVRTKNNILKNKLFIIPDWIALRDWVGNNLQYKDDSTIHGTSDYWQFPKETLSLRTGDCEDYAILLCSLFRIGGYSPNDVYVVVGKKGGAYHAWVKINLGILGWYNLEPQANGWSTLIGDFFSLSGYKAVCEFNDSQFRQVG